MLRRYLDFDVVVIVLIVVSLLGTIAYYSDSIQQRRCSAYIR